VGTPLSRFSRPGRPGRHGHKERLERPARAPGDERPDRPFTGYKLARAVLSADGAKTGFAGLTLGAERVYGVTAEASCVWSARHVPPRRWCGCGFYCLHELADARALGCATDNRPALLLEVAASGRYIRYERGLRYSRQRVRVISGSWCGCGNPGTALTDGGSGLVGWRHLTPVCDRCAVGRRVLSMARFAALLDGPGGRVRVEPPSESGISGDSAPEATAAESPYAVLSAEIALLHARLDDLQSRLDR
jgi:hypothetical protein